MSTFRHLDLFSGIGGWALAARWHGDIDTIGFCEIDSWCRRVLAKHWPGVPQHDDVRTLDAATVARWCDGGCIDLITASYPCQPFSVAGQRRGEADDRHLWPEVARLVAELRPRYFCAENVSGHISMGLDTVLTDLEAIGYAAGTVVVPAGAVNALHRRDRVWILAIEGTVGVGIDADRAGRQQQRGSEPVRAEHATTEHVGGTASMANGDGVRSTERRECAGVADEGGEWRAERSGGHGDARQIPVRCAGEHPGEAMANATCQCGERTGRTWHRRAESPDSGTSLPDTDASGRGASQRHLHAGQPDIAGCGEGMADANASRQPQPQGTDGQEWGRPGVGGCGTTLPDAMCDRTPARLAGSVTRQARRARVTIDEGDETNPRHDAAHEVVGTLDTRIDGIFTGLVRRFATGPAEPDLIRAAWADGTWEIDLPRVVAHEPERRQKLQAAGNAIVPIVAYEILRALLETQPDIFR